MSEELNKIEGRKGARTMQGHFLQSEAWEKFEQLEGHETLRLAGEGFRVMAVIHATKMGKYLFCPYGPVLNGKTEAERKEALKAALSSLVEEARARGAIFVRIEPAVKIAPETMKSLGLVRSHELEPEHTWVIDLTISQEDLLKGIEERKRKQWKNHEKKGVIIRKTKDAEEVGVLSEMLRKVGERNNFTPQDENHIKNQMKSGFATLYIAEFEGKPIAASLVYDGDGVRYAVHAGADAEHKKLAAGTILSVEEMVEAQANGAREFDFWGMTTSEDPKHPWYGFTQYKKSFGGRQVDYAGTWDLPVDKMKYKMYQVMRKMNRVLRKI